MEIKKFSEIEFILLETSKIKIGQKDLEKEIEFLKTLPIEIKSIKEEKLQVKSLFAGVVAIYPEKRVILYDGWQKLENTHESKRLFGFVLKKYADNKDTSPINYLFHELPMNK
ncbi:hypothetical protein KAI04_03070 [Candidatus Pacearchaeota archaeon]|nr:hypothetical protein [Candidatus Pacearchaeota archaeon]